MTARSRLGSGVVAIVGVTEDGKAGVVVGVTADLTSRFNAVDLVRDGLRSARRQGRRRPARHGAGRRARWRQGGRRAVGDRKSDGRRLNRPARDLATGPRKRAISDPDLRDRLYELLEHDHLPLFGRLALRPADRRLIVIDVLAMILASVPEFDASFGRLFTAIEVARRGGVRAGICGAALERGRALAAQHDAGAGAARICLLSSLGIIDLLAFLPAAIALITGDQHARWCCSACCRSSSWCAIRRRCARCWRRFMPSGARCSAAW